MLSTYATLEKKHGHLKLPELLYFSIWYHYVCYQISYPGSSNIRAKLPFQEEEFFKETINIKVKRS